MVLPWRSQALAQLFPHAEVVPHGSGHLTKAISEWPTNQIKSWMERENLHYHKEEREREEGEEGEREERKRKGQMLKDPPPPPSSSFEEKWKWIWRKFGTLSEIVEKRGGEKEKGEKEEGEKEEGEKEEGEKEKGEKEEGEEKIEKREEVIIKKRMRPDQKSLQFPLLLESNLW
eukprot:CAMPEP_0201501176 /NCGR_PEP_ID=MMETSP0151_2-20130828/83449_1 /ASSEMBLY_ACC=CAM_ASM_000257 /TAXON_ID=200890 /ORGANISM="Paramoeba atlantica, Strain 621/1 / CCAP 1560/9" /LENGTH=173 /DNA_ID=CAMNT_0047894663 /DNA_START=312 /DNA_END=830 /DNA_ORIENTATION=+